jgi:hypothetical protein
MTPRQRTHRTIEALPMTLHAPSVAWFIASLMILMVAVFDALSPIPYISTYGIWVAILAYVVLAVGNLAELGGAVYSRAAEKKSDA